MLESGESGALQPEDLDDRLGEDVLLDGARELSLGLLQLIGGPRGAGREEARADRRQRQGRGRHQSQSPVEPEQQGYVHEQTDQREQRVGKAGGESLVDIRQITGEMRDDIAGLRVRKKIHREALEVVEHHAAEVVQHVRADPGREVIRGHVGEESDDEAARQPRQYQEQQPAVPVGQRGVDDELQAQSKDRVEALLEQHRQEDQRALDPVGTPQCEGTSQDPDEPHHRLVLNVHGTVARSPAPLWVVAAVASSGSPRRLRWHAA